ncbi:MAG: hypothetical protein AAF242_18620 [Bacteroidota bacterium]
MNFIPSSSWNSAIGMNGFKWIVKNTFFKGFNQNIKFKSSAKLEEVKAIRQEMTFSEISHLIAFVLLLLVSIGLVFFNLTTFSLCLLIFNVLMNLYPSLLQQQNKRRIDRLMEFYQ